MDNANEHAQNDLQAKPENQKKNVQQDKEDQAKKPATKAEVKLNKMEVEILTYFSNLPTNRQKQMIDDHDIDFAKFMSAVSAHKREALEDDRVAVEKMLAEVAPKKAGEKWNLLDVRYRVSIKSFGEQGLTPVMIANHLTDVERENYPKRPKSWSFTPGMLSRFMKENDITAK